MHHRQERRSMRPTPQHDPPPQHDPQPQPQKGEQARGSERKQLSAPAGAERRGRAPLTRHSSAPDARATSRSVLACPPARPQAPPAGQNRAGQGRREACLAVPKCRAFPSPACRRLRSSGHPHGGEAGPGRRSRACAVSRPSGRACVCAVLRPHLCACAWCARARPRASARAATALAARCAPTGRPAAPPRTGTRERAGAAAGAAPSLARRG